MSATIIPYHPQYKLQVEEIFFESSTKKEFKDQAEKIEFEWKYLGFYLTHFSQYAWLAIYEGKVLGYVIGMPHTNDPELNHIQPHLKAFEEQFKLFPAHLHINCHHETRGKGIGKALILRLIAQLRVEKISGLHIMTDTTSENRFFYQRLGFDFEFVSGHVLFMGIRIQLS